MIKIREWLKHLTPPFRTLLMLLSGVIFLALLFSGIFSKGLNRFDRQVIEVVSSVDGTRQPSYLILPKNIDRRESEVPVVVSLHSWSADFQQRLPKLETGVIERGWIYLFPNFRGRNDKPEACASDISKQDVIDALDWVIAHYPVDKKRIYVTGESGGGFMTLAMVTSYPERWTAASVWVPLSDLRAWYDFHADDLYGEMTRKCVGGDPEDNFRAEAEMARRSPLHRMAAAKDVPLDIAAGAYDGHDGAPIPVWHSIVAFNALAQAVGAPEISAEEIGQLSRQEPALDKPKVSDMISDQTLGRTILLRRYAGESRITIFEGGHEGIPAAALAWFDAH